MIRSIRDFKIEHTPDEIDTVSGIDYYNCRKAEISFSALNHKLRQLIIKTIHENKGFNLTELAVRLNIEQAILSQHLVILKRARIVIAKRNGKYVLCAINPWRIEEINKFAKNLIG